MIYVDTSVLVAYYVEEPLSEEAEREMRKHSERSGPAISQLTILEFCSALSRKVRMNELEPSNGNKIIRLLNAHLKENMYIELPVEATHYRHACEWISRFDLPLRSLDALHLAIAGLANATLITADNHLAESAVALGINIKLLGV